MVMQQTLEEAIKKYFKNQERTNEEILNKLAYTYHKIETTNEELLNTLRQLMRKLVEIDESRLKAEGKSETKITERMNNLRNELSDILEGKK